MRQVYKEKGSEFKPTFPLTHKQRLTTFHLVTQSDHQTNHCKTYRVCVSSPLEVLESIRQAQDSGPDHSGDIVECGVVPFGGAVTGDGQPVIQLLMKNGVQVLVVHLRTGLRFGLDCIHSVE